MAITSCGCILSTMPFITSRVSIPVTPITPGERAATERTVSEMLSGKFSFKCLVTSILSTVLGPRESGVT